MGFESSRLHRLFVCVTSALGVCLGHMKSKTYSNCPVCQGLMLNPRSTYCSNSCQVESQFKQYIQRWLAGEVSGTSPHGGVSRHVRRYLVDRSGDRCEKCGWGQVNPTTGKVPLNVNHLNGDWLDSTPSNVELICPNCHSLTPNFGSLNRGRGGRRRGPSRFYVLMGP